MIIDTHVHLDTKRFNKDLTEVLKRARNNNIGKFIIPAIDSQNMDKLIKLAENNEDIFFSTGHHPNRLDTFDLKEIEKQVSHKKCVAIGECGLDWFRIPKGASINDIKKAQKEVFEAQIKLSIKYNKPLILHSRDTDEDMFETLMKYKDELVGGVIHCYVGSDKLLELEKYNFYYGIGGVVTYKSAIELRENIKKIPLNKLLIETDAPYLTPEPHRKKRNEPLYTNDILSEMSKILNIDEKELEKTIEENTNRLFKF